MIAFILRIFLGPISCLLATTFFLFQVEPFECEYEAHHAPNPETTVFSNFGLSWESFDKENAAEAFVAIPDLRIQLLRIVAPESDTRDPFSSPYQPIRDKSPPLIDG